MSQKLKRCYLGIFTVILTLNLLSLVACTISTNNAGNTDLSVTASQFIQYALFRFDTTTSAHTMTLPSAANIVANLSAPFVGEVILFSVAADGNNAVTLIPGTNVTIEPGASIVSGNSTVTMYFELDKITSGSEAVTTYRWYKR